MATVGPSHAGGKPFLPNNHNPQMTNYGKAKRHFCILCRKTYMKNRSHEHMHNILHHKQLELVLGNVDCHDCLVCKVFSMDLDQFAQHIATSQHEANLNSLLQKNIKAISLADTLPRESYNRILERSKNLKKEEKKIVRKERKRQKQIAGQKHASMPQRASGQHQAVHTRAGPNTFKQGNQMQQDNRTAVFQNKENKLDQHVDTTSNRSKNNSQSGGADIPLQQFPCAGVDQYHNRPYQTEDTTDFTSDQLPHSGSIIFSQDEHSGSFQPEKSAPASHMGIANPVSIQDMDVSSMLKEIRRALGVREPCRADREARKQTAAESGARPSEPCSSTLNKDVKTSQRNTDAPVSLSERCSSTLNKNVKTSEGSTGAPVSRETSQSLSSTSTVESNGNSRGKVRIAHKAAGEVTVRKIIPQFPALSGPKSKQSWRKRYSEKKNKQKSKEGLPSFRIEVLNPEHNPSAYVADDLPLSEGFHWESVSSPCAPLPPAIPAPLSPQQDAPASAPNAATQLESRIRASNVKVEREDENSDGNKRKRQQPQEDGASDKEGAVKRRKTKLKKDQNQMDHLLAVSLREEELSHSLQDLDKSLVLARNALQLAYTEVQRLVLLKQQCTAEVDGLRARRIEILQGMQEVYSASSNVVQVGTTSAGSSERSSTTAFAPLTNLYQTPTPASSMSQPPLASLPTPTIMVKQEVMSLPASLPPHAQMNSEEVPQLPPETYPVLPPSLLLPTPPTGAAPVVALPTVAPHAPAPPTVTVSEQTKPACSVPVNPSYLHPDSVPRERSSKEQVIQIDSEDEHEEHSSTERIKANESGGSRPSSSTAAGGDKGDESDDLMEVTEPSKTVVIDIDESENEESPDSGPSKGPSPQEAPQKGVGVDCSSSSTQTYQQHNLIKRQTASPVVPVGETSIPPVAVEVTEEEEDEEEPSLGGFSNHTGSVHGLHIHDGLLYTCSADNTARAYSLANRECQTVFEGHTSKVNCLLVSAFLNMPARLYTGSSDQTIRCYSLKSKKCLETITLADRVLCLHIAWNIVFAGLANGSVASFDLKTLKPLDVFECHGPRGVSCLGTAQEGARRVLLVGSYDNTISVRDAKSGLLLRSLEGHTKTVLCMKVVNDLVFSGSSDTSVHAHNIHTGELVRIYKGHGHAVTSIVILGKVMVTACLDKLVRVYELQSHDRLQVYGGHSDMVMCMAVHKSVIYTGCHDGSIQAAKLNLMKNYRCWVVPLGSCISCISTMM
ncbi:zinc finger protein 106-like isoform X2 [Dunckerocampus dactyliophorus]|uniref:zinc finger protein 106-like isoform X2 n=1 Tax=Dunckerocampus dactyliophorus TaxID=161453 RepID=UPI00240541D8|nr:zinc finger protein 106-like isoform X2 [Dunckerocampus dactyliophorus]